MPIKVKLCGFTTKETVDEAVSLGVSFLGFVFYSPSPRNISPQKAREISIDIPKSTKKVAVVVGISYEVLDKIIKNLQPDFIQIHGRVTPKEISLIKKKYNIPIIKAFSIESLKDLIDIELYQEVVDLFLFDTKSNNFGGSGISFDWRLVKGLDIKREWFLSGGLSASNLERAIEIAGAKMVDLSSGIEEVKGVKSSRLIKELMEVVEGIK